MKTHQFFSGEILDTTLGKIEYHSTQIQWECLDSKLGEGRPSVCIKTADREV